jgi:glycosyltransferase involved in cell wall biosynthesis
MAMGLPVVATRISGSEDIVEHGKTGLLVAPQNADALADALLVMLSNPEQAAAMGDHARQRVVQYCSLEQVANAYVHLYGQLLKEQGVRVCAVSQAS